MRSSTSPRVKLTDSPLAERGTAFNFYASPLVLDVTESCKILPNDLYSTI